MEHLATPPFPFTSVCGSFIVAGNFTLQLSVPPQETSPILIPHFHSPIPPSLPPSPPPHPHTHTGNLRHESHRLPHPQL